MSNLYSAMTIKSNRKFLEQLPQDNEHGKCCIPSFDSAAYQKARQFLNKHLIISHTDMDPKNVMWLDAASPVLIDWEGAGLINPTAEVITVAIEWAGITETLFRKDIFSAVIEAYCSNGACINNSDIHDALYGLVGGYLGWLEFNMYRSLDSAAFDRSTQQLGINETEMTLRKLNFLASNIPHFIQLLQNRSTLE